MPLAAFVHNCTQCTSCVAFFDVERNIREEREIDRERERERGREREREGVGKRADRDIKRVGV